MIYSDMNQNRLTWRDLILKGANFFYVGCGNKWTGFNDEIRNDCEEFKIFFLDLIQKKWPMASLVEEKRDYDFYSDPLVPEHFCLWMGFFVPGFYGDNLSDDALRQDVLRQIGMLVTKKYSRWVDVRLIFTPNGDYEASRAYRREWSPEDRIFFNSMAAK